MRKTLFIQIDNTPAPIEAENDYVPLDCKQINDFCSFVGDALIGDLKDSNGTPLYRLINPAGRLLSDFEKVDKANYDLIIAQWLDVLSEILHKGVTQCDEQFTICFQQQYTNWLLNSENDYFVEIGKSLQANDGKVYLDVDGIHEDIISALHMKINKFLNDNKDEIEYIVFSSERIGNSSYIVKQLKTVFDSCSFLRLEQWRNIINEEIQRRFLSLEDYRAFRIDNLILGVTKIDEVENVDKDGLLWYKGCQVWFKGGIWQKLYVTNFKENKESFEHFLNIVLRGVTDYELTYNSLRWHLKKKGFYVHEEPHYYEDFFVAKLRKETQNYWCQLEFFYSPCHSLSSTAEQKGTLYHINVELK
jgi:hypothetical protein